MRLHYVVALLLAALTSAILLTAYSDYQSNRKIIIKHIADWSSSSLLQTEASLIDALQRDNHAAMQKILDKSRATRPFINALSLSHDGNVYDHSSDRSLTGRALAHSYVTAGNDIAERIEAGETYFSLPLKYFRNNDWHEEKLLLDLDRDYIFYELVQRTTIRSLQMLVVMGLVFGGLFWLLHRLLIVPIYDIIHCVENREERRLVFKVKEFTTLAATIRDAFKRLAGQQEQLQLSFEQEQHLEEILRTVADINRLLSTSKDENDLLIRSCNRLAEHGDYQLAWIGYVHDDRVNIVAHSEDLTGYLNGGLGISLDPAEPSSAGPTAQSILNNQTVLTRNLSQSASYQLWRSRAELSRFHSSIALPLRPDRASPPFGSLAIYTINPEGFEPREIDMLEELADDIGFASNAFRQREKLRYHLSYDPLTGLPNRAMLLQAIAQEKSPEVMLLNIDRFREINDVYGFEVGDALIKAFADALELYAKDYPMLTLYSLGVDHFGLHFMASHGIDIREFAESMIKKLESRTYDCLGIDIMLQVTAGYACSPKQTVERAELALNHAKTEKRDVAIFVPTAMEVEQYKKNIQCYNAVRMALDEDRIEPYFQAIIDNNTRQPVKYETLMRLIGTDGEVILPGEFINVAKKTRLYPQLTMRVIRKTLALFNDSEISLSFNLSLEDMLNNDVVKTLRELIDCRQVAERITFEILESEGIEDYEGVSHFIQEFKSLGCKIAIDDFGTGYSNFEHLMKLQVDYIKIDGSLIQNIIHGGNAEALVKHIQEFAADMNMTTIAEFVSSQEIYQKVCQLGIGYSQGFYFHQPAAYDVLATELRTTDVPG